jgi:hypothetical protein
VVGVFYDMLGCSSHMHPYIVYSSTPVLLEAEQLRIGYGSVCPW